MSDKYEQIDIETHADALAAALYLAEDALSRIVSHLPKGALAGTDIPVISIIAASKNALENYSQVSSAELKGINQLKPQPRYYRGPASFNGD